VENILQINRVCLGTFMVVYRNIGHAQRRRPDNNARNIDKRDDIFNNDESQVDRDLVEAFRQPPDFLRTRTAPELRQPPHRPSQAVPR